MPTIGKIDASTETVNATLDISSNTSEPLSDKEDTRCLFLTRQQQLRAALQDIQPKIDSLNEMRNDTWLPFRAFLMIHYPFPNERAFQNYRFNRASLLMVSSFIFAIIFGVYSHPLFLLSVFWLHDFLGVLTIRAQRDVEIQASLRIGLIQQQGLQTLLDTPLIETNVLKGTEFVAEYFEWTPPLFKKIRREVGTQVEDSFAIPINLLKPISFQK